MKPLFPIALLLLVQLSLAQVEVIHSFEDAKASFIGSELTEDQVIVVQAGKDLLFYDITSEELSNPRQFDDYTSFQEGYALARKGQQFFYIDRLGNPVFKGKFDEGSSVRYGLASVRRKGEAYIINMQGKPAFKGKYERISVITDKIALVEENRVKFIIDTKGNRINNYSILSSYLASNGCYVYQTEKGQTIINRQGEIIGTSNYTKVKFIDPIIYFEKPNAKGFLNHEGEEFLTFDGYTRPRNTPLKSTFFYVYKNKIGALADTTGQLLTDFEYNHLRQMTSDRIVVTKNTPTGRQQGLIDLRGNVVVPLQWSNVNKFKNSGLFTVRAKNGDIQYENLVSADGEFFLPIENQNFKQLKYCSDELAVARLSDTTIDGRVLSRYALINRQGQRITKEPYQAIAQFVDGIAAAYRYVYVDGKLATQGGYLKSTGEFKSVNVNNCQNFQDGYAVFFTSENPRKYGLINQDLEIIVPLDSGYESIKNFFNEDLFVVKKGTLWGYIDKHGKEVIPPQYASAEPFVNGLGQVNYNLYINQRGDTVVNGLKGVIYRPDMQGYTLVGASGKVGLIDQQGQWHLNPEYRQITRLGSLPNGDPYWKVQLQDQSFTLVTLKGKGLLKESYPYLEVLYSDESSLLLGVKGKEQAQLLKLNL